MEVCVCVGLCPDFIPFFLYTPFDFLVCLIPLKMSSCDCSTSTQATPFHSLFGALEFHSVDTLPFIHATISLLP